MFLEGPLKAGDSDGVSVMGDGCQKILMVIPAFNEEASIEGTLQAIQAAGSLWDVLVVNDGSFDQTVQIVKRLGVDIISLPFNAGIGAAVSTGFFYALRKGYDVVVRIDADGQHDSFSVKAVLEPILNNSADMVIGSRFKEGVSEYRSSFFRRLGINFFAGLISVLIGDPVTDPTSGFNAFNQKAIRLFVDHYPSDYPEPEAIVMAKRAGLRLSEVPVKMKGRTAGKSSIRYLRTLYYMAKVTLAIALHYLRPKQKI